MKSWIKKRPWIWIVIFFIAFMSVWAWFVVLAVRNQPEKIPMETQTPVVRDES